MWTSSATLGVPPRLDPVDVSDLDPTLDACCRRDEEERRHGVALRAALRRHDRVAARERARRHLVTLNGNQEESFQGCRCCYDPNSDGGGDYRALLELRAEQQQQSSDIADNKEEDLKVHDERDHSVTDSDAELDDMLDGFDETGDVQGGTSEAAAWEERRRLELEEALWHRQAALEHGYGAHRPVHPGRALRVAGLGPEGKTLHPPPAAVVHLVDPDSRASASLDLCLERLATSDARGTVFVRTGGRSAILMDPDLAQRALPRLKVDTDLPALVAVRDGVAVAVCPNLQGLVDGDGNAVPNRVLQWLDRAGVLRDAPPPLEALCRLRPEEAALVDHLTASSRLAVAEDDIAGLDCYDCGLPECRKTYAHTHVGMETNQQSGLVLPVEGSGGAAVENLKS